MERALSRSTGRIAHFLDARNPSGLARFGGGKAAWLVVAVVGLLAAGVVLSRRRR